MVILRTLWLLGSAPPLRRGMTLELMRSHLSHEVAAKITRLSSLIAEWKEGRVLPGDPLEAAAILDDVIRISVPYSRLAASRISLLLSLGRAVAASLRLRGLALAGSALDPDRIRQIERTLRSLEEQHTRFVSRISHRWGVQATAVLRAVCGEIEREMRRRAGAPAPELVLEIESAQAGQTWLPRDDEGHWHDFFANVLRNAFEAASERQRDGCGIDDGGPGGRVTVIFRRGPDRDRSVVEIVDDGVGMSPVTVSRMWQSGFSRHGRGHGLTEAKRAFVEKRARLDVRSVPGQGTCVRVDFPPTEVEITPPSLWLSPPVTTTLLLALSAGLALGIPALRAGGGLGPGLVNPFSEPPAEILTMDDVVICRDSQARVLWKTRLHEPVSDNTPRDRMTSDGLYTAGVKDAQVLLRDSGQRPKGIVVATRPTAGSGSLWFLNTRGGIRARHRLRWDPFPGTPISNLHSPWRMQVPWPGSDSPVTAVHVRNQDYGATVTEFFTASGDSLGAYYHHGHLKFRLADDLDGDGKVEVLLWGINNDAAADTAFPTLSHEQYVECVLMLEIPKVSGQGYPYDLWPDIPPADEEGYLLIPPLTHAPRPLIYEINVGDAQAGAGRTIEIVIGDGRIYLCDEHLLPRSCETGDRTEARRLARESGAIPAVYFRHGRRQEMSFSLSPSQ
jgi:signal transduction histidine kinase